MPAITKDHSVDGSAGGVSQGIDIRIPGLARPAIVYRVLRGAGGWSLVALWKLGTAAKGLIPWILGGEKVVIT